MDNENKNQDKNQNGEIIFNIDVMLAKRKMSVTELAERVGITITNMSILKNGKAKALKISTLTKLCEYRRYAKNSLKNREKTLD